MALHYESDVYSKKEKRGIRDKKFSSMDIISNDHTEHTKQLTYFSKNHKLCWRLRGQDEVKQSPY